MADISLKGLLMDNGEATDRWARKVLKHYLAVDRIMQETADRFAAECGNNPYLMLSYVRKAVTGVQVGDTVVRYRPDLSWRLRAAGSRLCGLGAWVAVEPFYRLDRDRSGRDEKTADLADRLTRELPATMERFKVYEVMKQRLRTEASTLYHLLQRLEDVAGASEWMRPDANREAVLEARRRLLALRNEVGVTPAVMDI